MAGIYPSLPGLGWPVAKATKFATRTQKAISGRELRVIDQTIPIRTWTLSYTVLRDKHDTRGPAGLGAGFDELRTIEGFFLQQQGSFGAFLFDDPSDNTVTAQQIGIGDSVASAFQLVRSFGGFTEPVTAPNVVGGITFNGAWQPPAGYSVASATGIVTFTVPPPSGVVIGASFTYYFRVRFADDTLETSNFMYQLWELKQVKLQQVLA